MAIVDKFSSGTQLNLAAAWGSGSGPPPTNADLARWIATSNVTTAFTMGGSVTWGGIRYNDATGSSTFTNASAVTLTLAGYTDGATKYLIDMSAATSGTALQISAFASPNVALALGTGGGTIAVNTGTSFVTNAAITGSVGTITKTGSGSWSAFGASPSFSSPISLEAGSLALGVAVAAGDGFGTGKITMSSGTTITTGSSGSTRYLSNPIDVRGDVTFGGGGAGAGGSTQLNNAGVGVDFDSTPRTITVAGPTTISAKLTGTAGLIKAGVATLTVSSTSSTISGNVQVDAGTLSFSSTVLANATVVPSTGTLSWSAGTTIGALSGSGNLSVGATLTVGSATANTIQNISATYSGALSGASAITKAGTGKWTLTGTNTGYTGAITLSAGTLAGNSASAFGASTGTASVITQTGGTLEFGAVVNKGTNGVTLNSVGGADAVSAPSGTTGLTCAGVALSAASTIFNIAGGTFTLTNSAAMSGAGFGLTKTGSAEMVIASTANNTFTGAVTVSAGTLTIIGSAAPSSPGPLGNAATGVALTGTMKYAGTGAATISRSMTLTGSAPALEAAGTTSAAAVTFSAFTHAAGARTLTLKGDNTGDNTISAVLADADAGASAVGLTKVGLGKWILSAQPTYTGLTTVSAGELQFNELNLSNNLTVNGTGKLSKTVLNGTSKTITCDGGTPEIEATTVGNTVTGTTSVTAGSLRLTTEAQASAKPVKVLGDTAVFVTGTLQTTVGTVQRGQMRYGGNLTFNSGSALRIG